MKRLLSAFAILALMTSQAFAQASLQITLEGVDATNVNNGASLGITNNGQDLSANPLSGESYEVIEGGILVYQVEPNTNSRILVSGQTEAELGQITFNAIDDDIRVSDIYLINDVDGDGTPDVNSHPNIETRLDFELYNATGQLIQTKQMINGQLHFELANQDRIHVPLNDSSFATIKADVRAITDANQTGKSLALHVTEIEADTGSTGSDITRFSPGAILSTGAPFIAYKTVPSFEASPNQPSFNLSSASSLQEFYRFDILADPAGAVDIAKAKLRINLPVGGLTSTTGAISSDNFKLGIFNNGAVDPGSIDTIGDVLVTSNNGGIIDINLDFEQLRVSAGGTVTVSLLTENLRQSPGFTHDTINVNISFVNDTLLNGYGFVDVTSASQQDIQNQGASIVWSDEAGSPHSDTSLDWHPGLFVDIGPEISFSLEADDTPPLSPLTITQVDAEFDNDKIVAGVDDVNLLSFNISGANEGDSVVTALRFNVEVPDGTSPESITTAVFVDGVQQGSATQPDADGKFQFTDLSIVIPSAGSKKIQLIVDTVEELAQ